MSKIAKKPDHLNMDKFKKNALYLPGPCKLRWVNFNPSMDK